ncbi:MAG: putative manganese-dependent inorganic diphosphatase [Erysipelotrichaceae bacterium]
MINPVFITGHRNPDTDSICSSMAYANLKQLLGENAIACRLGPLNEESKFVTKYFDIEGPLLIKDARAQIRDIVFDEPKLIHQNSTVKQAWDMLLETSNRSLIVVDDKKHMQGILSTSNLAMIRLLDTDELSDLMSNATAEEISQTVNGSIIYCPNKFATNGKVYITTLLDKAMEIDLNNTICITAHSDEEQIQIIKAGCKCLIVTCNQEVLSYVVEIAKENQCAIIRCENDTMRTSKVINEAFPIHLISTKNPFSFTDTEFVEDASKKMANVRFRSYPVLNAYGDVVGQISRFHLQNYRRKKFILVDHSARNQSVRNIDEAEILEIIDHHHIGDIQTDYPVFFRNQKCGCTASIITQMYKENGVEPDRTHSGVLLSAIISDTLFFKSKTTTKFDIDIAHWLAEKAEVNIEEYALELLGASVDIKDADLKAVLKRDLKSYTMGKYSVAVGQTNYRDVEDIQSIMEDFMKTLEEVQVQKQYDLLIMMFTQVTAEGTMFVYTGPLSYVMEQVIETTFNENRGYDHDIISRKQQLIPKMGQILKNI